MTSGALNTTPDDGPFALIVGGTSGLGLPIVRSLLGFGYKVISVGRGTPYAGVSRHFICDLRDTSAWKATLDQMSSSLPQIAVAGFVTGYARAIPPERVEQEDRNVHYRLNADYVADSHQALSLLLQPDAKIFTIGSQWTFKRGCPYLIPYMMAKQALCAITQELKTLPISPQVRHYCVPTMQTPAFSAVKDSFHRINFANAFSDLGFEENISDPTEVANALIHHLLNEEGDDLAWRIDSKQTVSKASGSYAGKDYE